MAFLDETGLAELWSLIKQKTRASDWMPTATDVGAAPIITWEGNLISAGWYRIATVPSGGVKPFTMLLSIGGTYVNNAPKPSLVAIGIDRHNNSTKSASITKLLNIAGSNQITKARVVHDSNTLVCNIDVYYSKSSANNVKLSAQILAGSCTRVDFTKQVDEASDVMAECNLTEWLDPPMVSGEEYRTTERIGDKAVYKRNNGIIEYRLDGETEWKPYADAVGAAPAGYGLGVTRPPEIAVEDINKSGFYRCWLQKSNGHPINGWATFHAIVNDQYNNAHLSGKVGGGYIHRDRWNGVWSPWEWVNPPMELGVEYRTTERYMGKPVYTKLVDFGAFPAATTKIVAHGVENILYVVAVDAMSFKSDFCVYSTSFIPSVNRSDISITTTYDATSRGNCYVKMSYTKTTD